MSTWDHADVLKVRLQMQLVGQRGPSTGMVCCQAFDFALSQCSGLSVNSVLCLLMYAYRDNYLFKY